MSLSSLLLSSSKRKIFPLNDVNKHRCQGNVCPCWLETDWFGLVYSTYFSFNHIYIMFLGYLNSYQFSRKSHTICLSISRITVITHD